MSAGKEQWVECQVPCRDCPNYTNVTAKANCLHLWRHLIEATLMVGDGRKLPESIIERCRTLGASVGCDVTTGQIPSVQVYDEEPKTRDGFNKGLINPI